MLKKFKLLSYLVLLSVFILATCGNPSGSVEYFTVSFEADGGLPEPEIQKIEKGGLIVEPEEMAKTGYDFGEWYIDEECTIPWDFENDIVTEDITLFAKWAPSSGSSGGGGGGGGGGSGKVGGTTSTPKITITTQPTAITNVFEGNISISLNVTATVAPVGALTYQWYNNMINSNAGGTAILGETGMSFAIPAALMAAGSPYYYYCVISSVGAADVTSSVAIVNVNLYTVTFVSNGGTPVISQYVAHNSTASIPMAPTTTAGGATLNRFRGWYTDDGLFASPFNFGTPITSNRTIYADWGYRPGDVGPGSGKVYYRNDAGFNVNEYLPNFVSYIAYYLEASAGGWYTLTAPNDPQLTWQSTDSDIAGTDTAIGTGRRNTALILNNTYGDTTPAATACDNYTNGSLNDWFLPSQDELDLLNNCSYVDYLDLFSDYWSSSQILYFYAWNQDLLGGSHYLDLISESKSISRKVRAVRAF